RRRDEKTEDPAHDLGQDDGGDNDHEQRCEQAAGQVQCVEKLAHRLLRKGRWSWPPPFALLRYSLRYFLMMAWPVSPVSLSQSLVSSSPILCRPAMSLSLGSSTLMPCSCSVFFCALASCLLSFQPRFSAASAAFRMTCCVSSGRASNARLLTMTMFFGIQALMS